MRNLIREQGESPIEQTARVITRRRTAAGSRLYVGLYKNGGIGDLMQLAAVARAVRRKYPDAYITVLFRDFGPDADGIPLVQNILRGNRAIDHTVTFPVQEWNGCVRKFASLFDVFYEVQYVVRSYYWLNAWEQRVADLRLRPYARYADNFPKSNETLAETRQTQWEMLAESSGLDVSENDLWIESSTCPPELARKLFITVHNMAGGAALAKAVPLRLFGEITRRLARAGIRCVHVGAGTDPPIENTLDYRGRPINETAAIIRRSELLLDIEGGLGYIARAVGTRRAVFFGPTPPSVFKFGGDLIISTRKCEPCWWRTGGRWSVSCPEQHPFCKNICDDPDLVASQLTRFIKQERKRK